MTKFQELYDFVDRAKRNRKYPETTAHSLRAALKLYDAALNEEEKDSLDKVKGDFEQITRSVFNKNAEKFTASSLTTYKSRVQKVFADYEKYGDPTKMNNWTPKVIHRIKKTERRTSTSGASRQQSHEEFDPSDQPFTLSDKGKGWSVTVKSRGPMNTDIRTGVVAISSKLDEINKEYENENS